MKSPSKSSITRQFIIEKTASIFNTKGYAGTSISDLTEATGLTKGSIYGNFESKEEVALEAFDYNLSKIRNTIQDNIEREATYSGKLMVYARVYHTFSSSSFPAGGCPILNTATEADDTNNLLKDRAAKAIMRWKKSISELIQKGIVSGEFKSDADHPQIALAIIALIEGGLMIARVTNNASNLDKTLQTVQQIVNGIKK